MNVRLLNEQNKHPQKTLHTTFTFYLFYIPYYTVSYITQDKNNIPHRCYIYIKYSLDKHFNKILPRYIRGKSELKTILLLFNVCHNK